VRRVAGLLFVPALVVLIGSAPAASTAAGASMPIDHVIVLMQENRSFDTYFGQLHFEGQSAAEPEPKGASNPDPTNPGGPPIKAFHKTNYCEVADLDHSWNGAHREYDNGAMGGFTAANATTADPTGSRAMGYYDQKDLPFYYALYNTFATSDRYFSSVLSQTFPNRFYLLAGTSFGHIRNDLPPPDGFTQPTIFNLLDAAGISWRIYYSQIPFAFEFSYVRDHAAGHVFPISQYYVDAAAGNLPQVSFVDPVFASQADTETDEHPPSNVQVGERFVSDVTNALFTSPNWSSSAMFLTYDENGGYYDHVAPPPAPVPDNIPPMLQPGDVPGAFDRYGFRVPVVVISPYSRPHFVSHVVDDHTSILKFIETRFGLPSLTNRDAHADAMLGFFDFSHPSFATPPTLPAAPIDPAQFAACATAPPNGGF
jgi:phospholipase C